MGCTWVKPVEGVESIALVKAAVVQDCEKLVTSTVLVTHKVGFINRNPSKVANELLTLARNEAVALDADTIVAEGPAMEGKQRFGLYQCR